MTKFVAAIVAIVGTLLGQTPQLSDEERARLQFDNGRAHMAAANYQEALKDFRAVVDTHPNSSVADNALMEIAKYYLEFTGDLVEARKNVEQLRTKYPNGDAAASAYILEGRIALTAGRTTDSLRRAAADFNRARTVFPDSSDVPEAIFYLAESQRLGGNGEAAIGSYREIQRTYSQSIWSARSRFGLARCLLTTGHADAAMVETQRVIADFPSSPEAILAAESNTILFRLYLRSHPYDFSGRFVAGRDGKIKDVHALAIMPSGELLVANASGVFAFDAESKQTRALMRLHPQSLFGDSLGRVLVADSQQLSRDDGPPFAVPFSRPGKPPETLHDISAAILTATQDLLVADRNAKGIFAYTPSAKAPRSFAMGQFVRLTTNRDGDVAALSSERSVRVFDRDGKLLQTIPTRGGGYEFEKPTDLAFDALGHLYVLDGGRGTVYVFLCATGKMITKFDSPEKAAGAFHKATALALDRAGRLYIYDSRAERVNVYQ